MARPTKLTPELQDRLCEVLRAGNYIEAACAYVGIDSSQYRRWHEKNYTFRTAVDTARAQAEVGSVARIRKAGQEGDWRADAWWLERSFNDRWGKQVSEQRHSGSIRMYSVDIGDDGSNSDTTADNDNA